MYTRLSESISGLHRTEIERNVCDLAPKNCSISNLAILPWLMSIIFSQTHFNLMRHILTYGYA